jgi:hypothetical protein
MSWRNIAEQYYVRITELEDRLKLERDSYAGVQRNLEKHIAKLEAERDAAKQGRQLVLETMQAENDALRTRITELETMVQNLGNALVRASEDFLKLVAQLESRLQEKPS